MASVAFDICVRVMWEVILLWEAIIVGGDLLRDVAKLREMIQLLTMILFRLFSGLWRWPCRITLDDT